jgi:hypothetical protein
MDKKDIPFIIETIDYCRKRRVLAWGKKEEKVWSVRIAANEELLARFNER